MSSDSLAGDPRVRWSFLANTYATGWLWHPKGYGLLHCTDGLLQFEPTSNTPLRRWKPYRHTHPRVLLLNPWAIPNHFTVVVFEGGLVSISIAKNREKIRTVLAECGFEIVDAPPQRMYPFNQRKAWDRHMREKVLSTALPEGTVLGGADGPMEIRFDCLACSAELVFDYADIEMRWHGAAPGVQPPLPRWQQFNDDRPLRQAAGLREGERALDIRCWSCLTPMRLIAEADEWRMSLWRYFITEQLVLVPDPR
jgi:hypothetical protein